MDGKELSLRKRVRQQILELISRMDFSYSTRLLSENQLAAKFQVSRSTIRAVLSELEAEGKVIRRHGSGTYANPPALNVTSTLYPRVNMYDLIQKNGFQPKVRVLSVRDMPAGDRGPKLNLFPFDQITEMRSVYYAGEKPCMYCVDCVDARRFGGLDWLEYERSPDSIYRFIRQASGVDLTWDIIEIQAVHTGQMPELQSFFAPPEGTVKPLVLLEITNFDRWNQPSLLGNIYVDSSLVRLHIVGDLTEL